MKNSLITSGVWAAIQSAAESCKQPAHVAVAYFGKGAAGLLPLPAGSRLVVDASDLAVSKGQTCPAELIKLQKRRVFVYRWGNLHAKLFVFGRKTFIGSANASAHSKNILQEAMLCTSDGGVAQDARRFVNELCADKLGSEELERLAKIYKPPTFPKGKSAVKALPSVRIALTKFAAVSDEVARAGEVGAKVAKARATVAKGYSIDWITWSGKCGFKVGDVMVQVLRTGRGQSIHPPGHILYLKKAEKTKTLVFGEFPDDPPIPLSRAPLAIRRILSRGGPVSQAKATVLLRYLNRPLAVSR